jgi:hypothetical protein
VEEKYANLALFCSGVGSICSLLLVLVERRLKTKSNGKKHGFPLELEGKYLKMGKKGFKRDGCSLHKVPGAQQSPLQTKNRQ